MMKARLFDDLESARSLLVWGDTGDMSTFEQNLVRMLAGDVQECVVNGDRDVLTLRVAEQPGRSHVETDGQSLLWECSIETLQKARDLVGPLLAGAGHQYIDASGAADQVIISAGEYPTDFPS